MSFTICWRYVPLERRFRIFMVGTRNVMKLARQCWAFFEASDLVTCGQYSPSGAMFQSMEVPAIVAFNCASVYLRWSQMTFLLHQLPTRLVSVAALLRCFLPSLHPLLRFAQVCSVTFLLTFIAIIYNLPSIQFGHPNVADSIRLCSADQVGSPGTRTRSAKNTSSILL